MCGTGVHLGGRDYLFQRVGDSGGKKAAGARPYRGFVGHGYIEVQGGGGAMPKVKEEELVRFKAEGDTVGGVPVKWDQEGLWIAGHNVDKMQDGDRCYVPALSDSRRRTM